MHSVGPISYINWFGPVGPTLSPFPSVHKGPIYSTTVPIVKEETENMQLEVLNVNYHKHLNRFMALEEETGG